MVKVINKCRACPGNNFVEFLDLGRQYISDFRDDLTKPPKYPLVVVICDDCKLVQLKHSIPQSDIYHERYGFKSSISDDVVIDLDDVVTHAFQYQNDPKSWLDIGSNDGTLLSFVPNDIYKVGVDPVSLLCAEAESHADLIINDFFGDQVGGEYDVITTISCFYDMPDLVKFVTDVKEILADKGIWIIQQNYLLTTMKLRAIDNFVHEHLTYFTLLSLERLLDQFELEVNEVYLSDVNGGSIRTIVSRKGNYPVGKSVQRQRQAEARFGIDHFGCYQEFADNLRVNLNKLRRLVLDLKLSRKRIAILAASTRGSTIWQSADIGEFIEYAVERNPAKVGKIYSALGIPIISEAEFRRLKPDYAIVGPWFFAESIIKREKDYLKQGGHFIVPLPKVKIVDLIL